MNLSFVSMEREYQALYQLFGVASSCWDMIHQKYSQYVFCPENRKDLVAEYLLWEDFVERAKEVNFTYYYGIDNFLREYKNAVYNWLNQ